jgi:hypothetical protein
MSATVIPIIALVSTSERAAVEAACGHIVRALSEASGQPWTCDCRFIDRPTDLQAHATRAILVTSLVSEVEGQELWPDAEARVRRFYAGLCRRGDPVFVCTLLRHAESDDPDLALHRRIRIRRLNLLAADISRQSGAFVIDIDRRLADVGARRLGTDYRLHGATAADLAGNAIAREILVNGLDALASAEVQDRARAALARWQPAIALPSLKPRHLMPIGHGRRKQMVATVTDINQQGDASWLIRQVLRRRIGPVDAFDTLVQVVRRRGARETFALLASGVVRLIGKRT